MYEKITCEISLLPGDVKRYGTEEDTQYANKHGEERKKREGERSRERIICLSVIFSMKFRLLRLGSRIKRAFITGTPESQFEIFSQTNFMARSSQRRQSCIVGRCNAAIR
jgi:hypothetical protein